MKLADDQLRGLSAALALRDEVELAVLFGSAAMDRLGPESDVDVYVCLRPGRRWSIAQELGVSSQLSRLVRREIHLTVEDLDSTSVILRREVANSGRVLWEQHPGAWTGMRARASVAYADLEPWMRRCGEGVRRVLAGKAPRG